MSEITQPARCRTVQAPTCPSTKHGHYATHFTKINSSNQKKYATFKCGKVDCKMVLYARAPQCPLNFKHEVLDEVGHGDFFWRCATPGHLHTEIMDFCDDCGGTGWLHMDNRAGATDSAGSLVVGVDYGMHVDACSTCNIFGDMVVAEREHRGTCGCGHGLPRQGFQNIWHGYPGRNGELTKALEKHFVVSRIRDELIEVEIGPQHADLFTAVLDRGYDLLMNDSLKTKEELSVSNQIDPNYVTAEKRIQLNAERREAAKTQSFAEGGGVSTPADERAVLLLQRKAQSEGYARAHKDLGVLKESIYALLGQLNNMTFQDQPVEMQRRLDSRRRALLSQMSHIDKNMVVAGNISTTNDRRHLVEKDQLPQHGGYEFQNLKKGENESVLHGTFYLDAHYYRAVLIEVHKVNGEQQPVNDPENWYYDLVAPLNHTVMQTITVQGFKGDYVLCVYPGGV